MKDFYNKILMSEAFAGQKLYQDLLHYLVSCSLRNETPKEINIAIEIFGKKTEYDPTKDSTVRVYIHNLRKKLQDYYKTQGQDDCVKLSIPKGSYKVEFHENYQQQLKRNFKPVILTTACLTILFGIIIWTVIWRSNQGRISKQDLIWGSLLRSQQKTKIVLGDHYFFKGYYKGKAWNIRDVDINSDQELKEYIAKNPSQLIQLSEYRKSYLPTRIPWCIAYLASIFNTHNLSYEMQISSHFQWDEINNRNIIYAGSFRALGILQNMLDERFRYSSQGHGITILSDSTQAGQKFFASDHEYYPFIDYALVVKQPGPRKSTMFFFVSTHDIGAIQVTRMFTDINSLKKFEAEYLNEKNIEYFEAIFEVKGYSHSSMEHRLVYFKEIKK